MRADPSTEPVRRPAARLVASMPRAAGLLTLALLTGCASDPSFGERLAADAQARTAVAERALEGERLVRRGEALIERGQRRIRRGEAEVREGRDAIERGEQLVREARREAEPDARSP